MFHIDKFIQDFIIERRGALIYKLTSHLNLNPRMAAVKLPCSSFGPNLFKNVTLINTKTSKKQRGQERMTFQCDLDVIFKFKMLADKLSKKFFWLMISIYEICKSYAKRFARIESDSTFGEGVSSLMASR